MGMKKQLDNVNMKAYVEHPVSADEAKELRDLGYEIVDIMFAPTNVSDIDIEYEDAPSNIGTITHPFKPNEIEIEMPPFTVGYLMDMIEHYEINMDTDIQRVRDLWDNGKQSRLIESILLGLPLPAFYFDTFSLPWGIIDGLQRCCSIQNFCVTKTLKLTGLEHLDMNGQGFDDLDRSLQRSIIMRPITVNLLKKSPTDVRHMLFKRLNTGGLMLNAQEIRNAMFQGKATKVLYELSTMQEFLKATDGRIKTDRMEDRDFVCRFIAFYLTDYYKYTPDLNMFLNVTMELLEKEDIEPIKQDFRKALLLAIDIFGNDAFRKRVNTEDQRRQLNKAYFEVITVNFSRLSNDEENLLRKNAEILKYNLIELMRNNKYNNSLSFATGTKDNVNVRFSWFKYVLQKSVQGRKVRISDDNKIEDI
ncbi:MAG: DUF262 domain-containing protein [Chitinispirillia bacterium]|nr:DUF262 domain-containing protein [Chitinispirillia bacterium]